jgi:peptidase M23-like protein
VPDLSLELMPPRVHVERVPTGQFLSLDLRFTNDAREDYQLSSVMLDVFDHSGTRIMCRLIDRHGLRPPIESIPDRIVPAGGSLLVFNPFHTFAADVELARVRCTCELSTDGGVEEVLTAEALVSHYEQKTKLYLPLTGRVLVAHGHDFLSPHRRIDPDHPFAAQLGVRANSGRFAEDFSLADDEGEATGLGAPVRAPGAGTVIAAVVDVADNVPLPEAPRGPRGAVEVPPDLPTDPSAMIFGNHVVIDHGNGEFSIVAHLQHESIEVEIGEAVEAKQPIARLGLSGSTDFPHIHYQVQDGPDAYVADGLPVTFAGFGPLAAGTIVESR